MDIQFRIAIDSDLPFLEAMEAECFPVSRRSNRRSMRLSLHSNSQEVWIAQELRHGQPIGLGSITLHLHRKSLRIFSIGVFPEYQGKGIGKQMLDHALDLARGRGCSYISLEADANNPQLLKWYSEYGFSSKEELPNYYAKGENAIRMTRPVDISQSLDTPSTAAGNIRNIVVVDDVADWHLNIEMTEVVSARKYITEQRYQNISSVRVFNLCKSYRYQTLGYYVSLLASARDHRVMPNVTTISDFSHMSIVQNLAEDLNELIQQSLASIDQPQYVLEIYFGQTSHSRMSQLARELYQLFESPLLQATFVKSGNWSIKKISPLSLSSIKEDRVGEVQTFAEKYFNKKRFRRSRLKQYQYDLAILHNPDEKHRPSCPVALKKFKEAGEKIGFYTEFITRRDYDRICEFDALFIRETTNVNNYTYQFSRRAYAEGLVVIDDPWSILRCSNKMYLSERMNRGRILMPGTWMLCKGKPLSGQVAGIRYPVVLKRPDSSFSRNMFKVSNDEDLKEKVNILFKDSELVVAQEFVRSDFDWRIGVLDQCPLFACKYYMAPGHWQIYNWEKANKEDSAGDAETLPINQVPTSVLEAAVKASSFIGDGLYGIDLKEINGQVYLIEVNDNPNIDAGIEDEVLGDEIYLRVVQSLYNRIEKARNTPRYVSVSQF